MSKNKYETTQSADGVGHLTYFHSPTQMSFCWAGSYDEPVEVSCGGYGEPVEWLIYLGASSFKFNGEIDIQSITERFAQLCEQFAETPELNEMKA